VIRDRCVEANLVYPNPFNSAAAIPFDVPHACHAKIVVYDLQGKMAADLLDKYINTGGHQVTFHAKDLASGLYFIHAVFSKNRVETILNQKIILLK
jgi:hypothetical protein